MDYQTSTYELYRLYHHADTAELKKCRYQLLLDRASRGDSLARKYICMIDGGKIIKRRRAYE